MVTNLYIARESFICDDIEKKDIKRYILEFANMVSYSKLIDGDNNCYLICKDLFHQCKIYNDITVLDILNLSEAARIQLGYDVCSIFIDMYKRLSNVVDDVNNETLKNESIETRSAICVLKHTDKYPMECQIISNIRELGKFRCMHFIKYPSSDEYFDEADKYMRGLALYPGIKKEYRKQFRTHKNKINHCLWILEEHYIPYFKNIEGSKTNCVEIFAKEYNLFDGGSYEGSDKFKQEKYRLEFANREDKVYCEPHIKMNSDDSGNKRQYCRIYFEEPRHLLGKVYVGHICKHL